MRTSRSRTSAAAASMGRRSAEPKMPSTSALKAAAQVTAAGEAERAGLDVLADRRDRGLDLLAVAAVAERDDKANGAAVGGALQWGRPRSRAKRVASQARSPRIRRRSAAVSPRSRR